MLAQFKLPVLRGQRLNGTTCVTRKISMKICVLRPSSQIQPASAPSSLDNDKKGLSQPLLGSSATIATFLLQANAALAKDGEYGLLEGRTIALLHPAVMLFLFGSSLYAGYLGYQWKRTRELGDEIRELKKSLPAAGPDGTRPPSPADSVIVLKEAVSKESNVMLNYSTLSHSVYCSGN